MIRLLVSAIPSPSAPGEHSQMFVTTASGLGPGLPAWAGGSNPESGLTPFVGRRKDEMLPIGHLASGLQAAELLNRRLAEASSLLRMARDLGATLELEPLCALILDQLEEATPCTSCTLYGREGKDLTALAYRGAQPASKVVGRPLPVELEQLLLGESTEGAATMPVFVHDRRQVALFQADLHAHVCLLVPLLVGMQAVGLLVLGYHTPDYLTPAHVEFLAALAGHMAPALEHAQRYRLARAAAAAEERRWLACELHDAVTQNLFAASLIAEALPDVWEHSPEIGRRGLQELSQLTRGALAEMRTLLLELRPATFSTAPLGELLRPLCAAFTSRSNVPVALTVQGDSHLPAKLQIALYRITQEALNNIFKHAQATKVTVALVHAADQVVLTITDDGVGFDPAQLTPDRLGLAIIRERCESLGAHFLLESAPHRGAQIQITCCTTQ